MGTSSVSQEAGYLQTAIALAERFQTDAVERDKQGGTPKQQRDWIRESGLLKLLIPTEYGGDGCRGQRYCA